MTGTDRRIAEQVFHDRQAAERLAAFISGRRPQDNLTLQPGDTLVVP